MMLLLHAAKGCMPVIRGQGVSDGNRARDRVKATNASSLAIAYITGYITGYTSGDDDEQSGTEASPAKLSLASS